MLFKKNWHSLFDNPSISIHYLISVLWAMLTCLHKKFASREKKDNINA